MNFSLFILCTFLTIPSIGQGIEKIIITSQKADEPPTKQGQPINKIEFVKQINGDLGTSYYYEDRKMIKLRTKAVLDIKRIERVMNWQMTDKRSFTQSELEFNVKALSADMNNYGLHFDIPNDFVVKVDSFQLCQTYKMIKSISTGGETITVSWINKSGEKTEFIFDSNDTGFGDFNMQNYLLCYTLLWNQIPVEMPNHEFFSSKKLTEILLNYQKTVECEGYYYKEYIKKNPNLTSQERRTMNGWDFVEYMQQRAIKE